MKRDVYIICGGTSLKPFNFRKLLKEDTIVVNKAILYVPNPNYFVTMDFTFLKKLRYTDKALSYTPAVKVFIANFTKPYLIEKNGQIVDERTELVYDLKEFDMIIKSYQTSGMGFRYNHFRNGGNSGFCGLQLAVLLGYKRIHLLGADFVVDRQTHFHGGYHQSAREFQKKLDVYLARWRQGIQELQEKRPDIEIFSCSKISKLNDIIPYKEI